ncbi:phage exclusion protein Lit family protein [Bradyrhizobium diazoefficiens]|uniref:phage exclusion protein Lit family protein n=1 Tax=Bradyrhizobium diazoefficiens TaxID=1355477 RepID=UPI00272B5FDF|nr:phage exclusion protein Lit family protein [Bradyrhizobium diazoefficiens]WLA64940.1 phage exclusion protein Lit family protein [Bradyrhizobium diazoefficiens]
MTTPTNPIPANDTASLMEPYFQLLGGNPLNIAPERATELMTDVFGGALWDLIAEKGAPPGGVQPFMADPDGKAITVSYSGLAMVWCMARFAILLRDVVKANRGAVEGPVDIGREMQTLRGYLEYAEALRQADLPWPNELMPPDIASVDQAEINNIFFGAVAWILLHEVGHVHRQHEVESGRSLKQEEEADEFAAGWVFEKVPDGRQREFRILAVGVALAWLLLFAPVGGDAKHPPAYSRVMHVSSHFEAAEDSVALEIVAHLFKALFFPTMTPPTFGTPAELFDWTVNQLRERSR